MAGRGPPPPPGGGRPPRPPPTAPTPPGPPTPPAAPRGRRRPPRPTDSRHDPPAAPNLPDRHFVADRPDTVWLADVSYLPTDEGWLNLAAIEDLATREVVGRGMADHLRAGLCVDA